jgi:hypothetical protein
MFDVAASTLGIVLENKSKRRLNMVEILGGNLEKVLRELNIVAVKTYEGITHLDNRTQVWELDNEDFEKLCKVPDDEWKDDYGWFRHAEGSNMGVVNRRYNINNHYIIAWDGAGREDHEEENKKLPVDDRYIEPRKYFDLFEYFCEEIGASTGKNVTALAIDLAKQNNMKLSELLIKYLD